MNTEIRSIDEVAWSLRMAREQGRGCALVIGAGCSVTAGIPAASGIVARVREKYTPDYDRAMEKTYPSVMAQLGAGERRDLIAYYVDKAKINWAHVCIAQLMKEGFVDRILTTNFDPLVVQACALVGCFPAVYDFAASQIFSAGDIPRNAVVYLHGQRSGFVLLNTRKEVSKHAKLLKPVFDEAGQGRVWIVVGYSGENDPVFDRIAGFRRFNYKLYWVGFGEGEPPAHVGSKLLKDGKDAFYVSGYDADTFFFSLAHELECFPPDFIGKPFSYLDRLMKTLSTSEEGQPGVKSGREYMSRAKTMITEAIHQFESGPTAEKERRAEDLLLTGKFDEVEQVEPEEVGLNTEMAWARILEGNRLGDEAVAASGDDADRLFAAAYEKYAAALALNPEMHDALNNWGITLRDQAKTKEGDEADRLFEAAYEKYDEALRIVPDDPDKIRNWADALADQAKTKEGDAADELFEAASEKYEEALAQRPNDPDMLGNWGIALHDQAKRKQGDEADRLFATAYEKYGAAVAGKPEDADKLRNWADALGDQAKTKEGAEADRLFAAAYERYEAASALRSDDPDLVGNWGVALHDQAKTKEGAEADRLFAAAYEKYAAAVALSPDDSAKLANWGLAYLDQAKRKQGTEARKLFLEADDKLQRAEAESPGSASYNLACSAALQGRAEDARHWLETSNTLGTLPPPNEVEGDPDLESIREESWFGELVASLR